ncbi:alpha/beta fold hydrolase [Promicromonospora panici]|uniref:alpha/beta fold hydrolase n=1 Tax=Promicromonospora panici TaxID=2219658 RepID=UPI0013E9A5F5|nr:alpha/beta fold hydrolase [Promicromonospora panici]
MTLTVDEFGPSDAPPVVLLHGVGTTGWMWTRQIAALSNELRLLVLDLPGHGRSRAVPWTSLADTASLVADLVAERTTDGRAHVVGLSLGGYVTLHLAATAPRTVSSALVSGVNVLPLPGSGRLRVLSALITPVMSWGPVVRANARALRVPEADLPGYTAAARTTSPRAFRRASDEALDYRVPVDAGASPVPLLAVAGEREHDLTRRSQSRIADAFPAGQARLAPGVGHAWNGERPDLFTAMVRAAVAGAPLPQELLPA